MAAAPCWSRSNRSAAQKCFNESFVLLKLLKHFIPSKMADEVGAMLQIISSHVLFFFFFWTVQMVRHEKKTKKNKLILINMCPIAARDKYFKKRMKLLLGNHTGLMMKIWFLVFNLSLQKRILPYYEDVLSCCWSVNAAAAYEVCFYFSSNLHQLSRPHFFGNVTTWPTFSVDVQNKRSFSFSLSSLFFLKNFSYFGCCILTCTNTFRVCFLFVFFKEALNHRCMFVSRGWSSVM